MSAYGHHLLRREKSRLENFWAVPVNRNWVLVLIGVVCGMVILTSDSFFAALDSSEDNQNLDWKSSANGYLQLGNNNHVKRNPKQRRFENVHHPITWMIYKLKMSKILEDQRSAAMKANNLTRLSKAELTPENAKHLDDLEELLTEAYIQNNVTDPIQRLLMGLTNETVDMDDPRAIEYLREQQTNVSVVPPANWRQHRLELSVLEQTGSFERDSILKTQISESILTYGKQTQVDIYNKYFARNGFANRTFVQVGAKSRFACWECQIVRKAMVNWTGLVTEMNSFEVEYDFYATAAPFCVAPATKPGVYMSKFLSYKTWTPVNSRDPRVWTQERAEKTPNTLSPLMYQSTLLPLTDIDATLTEPVRNNYTHISLRPVQCYPLWTIMQANNISDVDYLTIGTTGYAGKILETLPFDKIHPQVIHLADLGDAQGKSTLKFLEKRGFKLDPSLTTVTNENLHYGDYIFFKHDYY